MSARLARIAARLDRLRQVPAAVLAAIVRRDGLCMRPPADAEPPWQNEELTDRELAVELCGDCPVPDECLELELRTAGPHTVGVWGALTTGDLRALYRLWSRQRGHHNHGADTKGETP